jgi:nicotinamidase-related amidase
VTEKQEPSAVALVLIDVINGFDFEGSEALVKAAHAAAPRILALRKRAHAAGVPVMYVNDNFGQWRSDFRATVAACSGAELPGHGVTRMLVPTERDYFVLKPRHSGFYGTALELLLEQFQAKTLVLAGFATNICLLLTAHDAYMRGYQVLAPADCTASNSPQLTEQALEQMRLVADAKTDESSRIDFDELRKATSR